MMRAHDSQLGTTDRRMKFEKRERGKVKTDIIEDGREADQAQEGAEGRPLACSRLCPLRAALIEPLFPGCHSG